MEIIYYIYLNDKNIEVITDIYIDKIIVPKIVYLYLNDKHIEVLTSFSKYNNLSRLNINNNNIQNIPDLPNGLKYLNIRDNFIEKLPCNLPQTLLSLDCANNNIEVIIKIPYSVQILICHNNPIKYINISENTNLLRLDCLNNDYHFSYNELPTSLKVLNREKIVKQPEFQIFDSDSDNDSEKNNCCCWK